MQPRRTRIHLLLAGLIAGALTATTVAATMVGAGDFDQTREDRDWKTTERTLRLDQDAGGFSWESSLATAELTDTIEGAFQAADDRLTFALASTAEAQPDPLSNELTVDLLALIEFDDEDEDGMYDVGERVYQRVHIAELERPSVTAQPYYDHGHRVIVTYALPQQEQDNGFPVGGSTTAPGTLRLAFYVLPEVRSVDGTVVHPTDAKFDVVLDAFPYLQNTSAVALHASVAATAGLAPEDGALRSGQGMTGLAFSWTDVVSADREPGTVGATTLGNDDGTYDVVLAYPHARVLEHDATLSAHRYESTSIFKGIQEAFTKGDPVVYMAGLALTAAAVGGVAFHRIRRAD
jgi:hypothetical protein